MTTHGRIPFVHQLENESARQWLTHLQRAMPEYRVCELSDCSLTERQMMTVAIVANPDPAELRLLPRLEWVHSLWAGVEGLLAQWDDQRLRIVRMKDPELAGTMSEAVLAWVLFLHRKMPLYAHQQRQKCWQALPFRPATQCRVLILGAGALGAASAVRLQANHFPVSIWSRRQKSLPGIQAWSGCDGFKAAFREADIIVNLLPLTDETRGLIDAQALACLPDEACLINFGRGATVITEDLLQALDCGRLSHAVLDVFEQEPLSAESPLWEHEKITLLPHISAPTTMTSASQIVAGHIRTYIASGVIPESVDWQRGY